MSHPLNSHSYKHQAEKDKLKVSPFSTPCRRFGGWCTEKEDLPAPDWKCGGWNNIAAVHLHSWCRTAQSCLSRSPQSQKCPEHQWINTEKEEHEQKWGGWGGGGLKIQIIKITGLIVLTNEPTLWEIPAVVYESLSLTGIDSSISFLLSSAWLMRSTIQSNKALYKDLAMESLAVIAW